MDSNLEPPAEVDFIEDVWDTADAFYALVSPAVKKKARKCLCCGDYFNTVPSARICGNCRGRKTVIRW